MAFFITALRRIGRGTLSKLFNGFFFVGLVGWDLSLAFINMITFKRKVGHVTPKGHPGEGGVWPEYRPPRKGDSRCCCPALNAMANHGVFYFFFVFLRYPRWINKYVMHVLTISTFLNSILRIPPPSAQVSSLAMDAISLSVI